MPPVISWRMGGKPRGYSGTPLPKKLGIKDGDEVAMLGAPAALRGELAELAPAARIVAAQGPDTALVMWFVFDNAALQAGVAERARRTPPGGLWICWRKKSAHPGGDVGDGEVRAAALARGIVNYKVAAIDETWSGLKFAIRRAT